MVGEEGEAPTDPGARLNAEDRALVAAYWWSRAEGEITSWVGFQHVLADLRAEASPAPVLALAERAVADEYRHAEWCAGWARRFGHAGGMPAPRAQQAVAFDGAREEENRVLRIALCCLTETVGCFILQHVRPSVVDPELRALNRRHMADELQHSRVGWAHLATLDAERRALVGRRLPELFRALQTACCEGTEREREDLVGFGYFTPGLLRRAHDEALREVIRPGLDSLDIRGAIS